MTATDFHPIRTAMMVGVTRSRLNAAHTDQPEQRPAGLSRLPRQWQPKAMTPALTQDEGVEREIVNSYPAEERGRLPEPRCISAVKGLTAFENLFAAVQKSNYPIIDLSHVVQSGLPENDDCGESQAMHPVFSGSIYVHFGDTGIRGIGQNVVTGAYVTARATGTGSTGTIQFVGTDPRWHETREAPLFETLYEHQRSAVIMFRAPKKGDFTFSPLASSVEMPKDDPARLLPLVKMAVDIAMGISDDFDMEYRTEHFFGGSNAGTQHCSIDVAEVWPKPDLALEAASPAYR